MMPITIVAGPAGAGKSDVTRDRLGAVVIDTTLLFNALFPSLAGRVRSGEDGRLRLVQYVKMVALRAAVESNLDGFVTVADPSKIDSLLAVTGEPRETGLKILDPGRRVVLERLRDSQGTDRISDCTKAVDRWYSKVGTS